MENSEVDRLLDEVLIHLEQGKSYAAIRDHYRNQVDEKTIAYVIRLADELVIEENRIKSEYKKSMFKVYMGIAFLIFTLLVFFELYFREGIHPIKKLLVLLPLAISGYFLVRSYIEAMKWKKAQPEVDDSKFKLRRRNKI
jgi:hypothetical protein